MWIHYHLYANNQLALHPWRTMQKAPNTATSKRSCNQIVFSVLKNEQVNEESDTLQSIQILEFL